MDTLGNRLRRQRKARELSLKQLAALVGCTPSYLSMVENDKLDPSVSRLKKIADALGATIVKLFSEGSGEEGVVLRREERQRVSVHGSKLLIEILIRQGSEKKMDARLAIVAPGGGSVGEYTHTGEEFGYLIRGTLELSVNGTTYVLREGDTFYFNSTSPHSFRNVSEEEAEVLWVNHPPSW
ncbi:MAG: cupin domain-containing protein [Thermodesulfobacteriota bacterium]